MAGSSNFKVFNESLSNAQSDADYLSETQRTGGLTNGIAKTAMHNKLFRQVSIMAAAIGKFISDKGNVASDEDVEALTSAFADSVASGPAGLLAAHAIDYTLQIPHGGTTTNVGNAYAIAAPAIAALDDKMAICIKVNADSTGAVTLNWDGKGDKAIKKANGSAVTNLKNGGVYTLRYDGTNFILQGEGASGDATASDLLSGKTATVDAGEITGTLALTGDALVGNVLSGKKFYKDDATAQLTGTMTNKVGSATVITPGTLDQAIAQGYYGGAAGDGKVLGDADLAAANIKSGVNIFGVAGSLVEKHSAGGTGFTGTTVSGLSFTPTMVCCNYGGNTTGIYIPGYIDFIMHDDGIHGSYASTGNSITFNEDGFTSSFAFSAGAWWCSDVL